MEHWEKLQCRESCLLIQKTSKTTTDRGNVGPVCSLSYLYGLRALFPMRPPFEKTTSKAPGETRDQEADASGFGGWTYVPSQLWASGNGGKSLSLSFPLCSAHFLGLWCWLDENEHIEGLWLGSAWAENTVLFPVLC
jgi:hypothetical protein